MELVIDANVIISAMISWLGKTRDLIFSDKIILFAPEYLAEEFEEHKLEILEKSRLSESDFQLALSLIFSVINFIPMAEFERFIPIARDKCPDEDDLEYFALSLSKNIPIWSDDKALKNQDIINIISTSELIKIIS